MLGPQCGVHIANIRVLEGRLCGHCNDDKSFPSCIPLLSSFVFHRFPSSPPLLPPLSLSPSLSLTLQEVSALGWLQLGGGAGKQRGEDGTEVPGGGKGARGGVVGAGLKEEDEGERNEKRDICDHAS